MQDSSTGEHSSSEPSFATGIVLPDETRSLREVFDGVAVQYADQEAVVSLHQRHDILSNNSINSPGVQHPSVRWTYGQLKHGSDRLATALYGAGLRQGMPFAVFISNYVEWALAFFASLRLALPFAPIDSRVIERPAEIQHYLRLFHPRAILVTDCSAAAKLEANAGDFLKDIKVATFISEKDDGTAATLLWEPLEKLLSHDIEAQQLEINAAEHVDKDPILIIFTSGTSRPAKACVHTSQSVCAGTSGVQYLRSLDSNCSLLQHLPLSHILATLSVLAFWRFGGKVVFPAPSFSAKSTLDGLWRERCSHMSAVPAIIYTMLSESNFSPSITSCLKNVAIGGSIVSPAVLRTVTDSKRIAAQTVSPGFGMSEGTPVLGWSQYETPTSNGMLTSVGKPVPGTKAKVCRPHSREPVPRGVRGELHVGGKQVITKYLDPSDGRGNLYLDECGLPWIATGDEASMDMQGAVYITGRFKDTIVRGGENISPGPIETILEITPGVVKAELVGIADEFDGEVPVAVIRVRKGASLDYSAMRENVGRQLGSSSIPSSIFTLDQLNLEAFPSTASGKVKKKELKDLVSKIISKASSTPQALANGTNGQYTTPGMRPNSSPIDGSPERSNPEETREGSTIVALWKRLTGQSISKKHLGMEIKHMADSLTLIRFAREVERETGAKLPMMTLAADTSLRNVISLTQRTNPIHEDSRSMPVRKGYPRAKDMVHTWGDTEIAQRTCDGFQTILQRLGLSWAEDVEECFPVPDFPQNFLNNPSRGISVTILSIWLVRNAGLGQTTSALKRSLQTWPLSRAVVQKVDEQWLYAIVRGSDRWLDQIVSCEPSLDRTKDLMAMVLENNSRIAHAEGPLLRIYVVPIQDTSDIEIVTLCHHAVADGVSLSNWKKDFEALMTNPSTDPPPRQLYQTYAEIFHDYRRSVPAQTSVNYHVQRLQNVHCESDSLWPPQRAPGWHIGRDDAKYLSVAGVSSHRRHLDGDGQRMGLEGMKSDVKIPQLPELAGKGIPAPILLKGAVALLNIFHNGTSTALFGGVYAGRTWPFLHPALDFKMGSAADIGGPCLETIVHRIHVDRKTQTVEEFLKVLATEQEQHIQHVHAPQNAVKAALGPGDADMMAQIRKRQIFNWFGGWQTSEIAKAARQPSHTASHPGAENTQIVLENIATHWIADCGIGWKCAFVAQDCVRVWISWDNAQVKVAEAKLWLDQLCRITRSLAHQEHLSWSLARVLGDV